MDLFTHVIFAYLLSFIVWGPAAPQYIAAGALAGGLPDADILLFPLTRWFPSLHHRGVVHTVVGVTLIAAVGSLVVPYLPYFTPASTLLYFVAMEIGGLSHLALDGFTNYAVRPFLPFSGRALRLNADVAVSLVTMVMTAGTLIVLVLEHGTVAFGVWEETVWILVGIYGAYLVFRSVARWRAGTRRRALGYSEVLPSTNPWKWLLLEENETPDRYRIRFRRFSLGSDSEGADRVLDVGKVPPRPGPVHSAQEALERTYVPAMAKSGWLAESYHFGEAREKGAVFEVWWYIVNQGSGRRTYGVHGQIDRTTGAVSLRSGFVTIPSGPIM
ncbi:MAG TPA: metal-dependent hydrolase [Thermoplasmata archaeon]|nr:metal-dependent hydrolase [Thermoplasmata archaeon]